MPSPFLCWVCTHDIFFFFDRTHLIRWSLAIRVVAAINHLLCRNNYIEYVSVRRDERRTERKGEWWWRWRSYYNNIKHLNRYSVSSVLRAHRADSERTHEIKEKWEMPCAWGAELTWLNRAGKLRAQKSRFFFVHISVRLVSFRVQFLTNIMLMWAEDLCSEWQKRDSAK